MLRGMHNDGMQNKLGLQRCLSLALWRQIAARSVKVEATVKLAQMRQGLCKWRKSRQYSVQKSAGGHLALLWLLRKNFNRWCRVNTAQLRAHTNTKLATCHQQQSVYKSWKGQLHTRNTSKWRKFTAIRHWHKSMAHSTLAVWRLLVVREGAAEIQQKCEDLRALQFAWQCWLLVQGRELIDHQTMASATYHACMKDLETTVQWNGAWQPSAVRK